MTSQDWIISPAGPDDLAALALVGAATFLESFAGILNGAGLVRHCTERHSITAYREYLEGGAKAWLGLAEQGGAPVGFALLAEADLPGMQPGDIELKRIYTLSRYHGSGLGPALMQQAVNAAAGYKRLVLGVYAQNERAIRFYEKQGFHQIGTRQFDIGGSIYDDVVLARPLTN